MTWADGLVNDNGISAIALAFFTALFGMVGTIVVAVLKQRKPIKDAQESSLSTGRLVERKLDILARNHDRLETQIDDLNRAVRDHMEWHLLSQEGKDNEQRQQQSARYFGRRAGG